MLFFLHTDLFLAAVFLSWKKHWPSSAVEALSGLWISLTTGAMAELRWPSLPPS